MARQRCLRHLKSPPERSSRRIQTGGVVSSSSTSWTASPRLFRTASFTSSSTISTPTRRTSTGSRPTPIAISFHADKRVLAQSGRGLVLDLAGAVAQRRFLHKPQTARAAHQCLHQSLQRPSSALRLDQEKGPSTPIQRPPYHSALIPGTSLVCRGDGEYHRRSVACNARGVA